jgi:uncharacterized protein
MMEDTWGRAMRRDNAAMPRPQDRTTTTAPMSDAQVARLQGLLEDLPEPLQPLDVSSLDGFLCGVLLQPKTIDESRWMPFVTDVDGRALPPDVDAGELHTLVRRRHAELDRAIAARRWFDPWVFEVDAGAPPTTHVLPWIAGFAAAMDRFPGLMGVDDPDLLEPLALLYLHFDAQDLEDAQALTALIETLEPPADLAEAVQDIVHSLMLMADVVHPPGAGSRHGQPTARRRR